VVAERRTVVELHPQGMTSRTTVRATVDLPVDLRDRGVILSEHNVVMAVATYGSRADASRDFADILSLCRPDLEHVAVAQVSKGGDGQLTMDRHAGSDTGQAWRRALLGAALAAIAAPLGFQFLGPLAATRAASAGIAALVGVFWHHIPKDRLHKMSDLLEARQAALVVVALDCTGDEIGAVLSGRASATLVATTADDFEATYRHGLEAGGARDGHCP
jgi:hypothetical protein